MRYREIPKNGDKLSILGYGCMRFPMTEEGQIDEARTVSQIHGAISRGVNYFDTAWPYHAGESENILGRALSGGYREKVRIATKLPTWMVTRRGDMDTFLNTQLEKLQTDHIDYYLVHALAWDSWDRLVSLDVAEFLDTAKKDGRIVNAGFSFHGKCEDFKQIVDAYPWEFCQIQYNYLDEENQAGTEGLKYAASRNLGVVVMEPLRGGNLGLPQAPPAVAAVWKKAASHRTPVAWALRWIWNHPEVTVILSGMNAEDHIEENIDIAADALPNSMTDDELALVEEAGAKYKELMKVGCTGCGYCLPCPSDVGIPAIFEIYNKMHMFGNMDEAKFMYAIRMSGMLTGTASYASQCVQCGECVGKCPQNIDIPKFLEKAVAELEDEELEKRIAIGKKMFNMT